MLLTPKIIEQTESVVYLHFLLHLETQPYVFFWDLFISLQKLLGPTKAVVWDDGKTELRPCCTSYGQCAIKQEMNCNCEDCFDYSLLDAIESALVDPGSIVPTENSFASVIVFDSDGVASQFFLPNPLSENYFDAHEFANERTDSSTYTR